MEVVLKRVLHIALTVLMTSYFERTVLVYDKTVSAITNSRQIGNNRPISTRCQTLKWGNVHPLTNRH
jgi:hypothetical protein